jgi:hypothetical protein
MKFKIICKKGQFDKNYDLFMYVMYTKIIFCIINHIIAKQAPAIPNYLIRLRFISSIYLSLSNIVSKEIICNAIMISI